MIRKRLALAALALALTAPAALPEETTLNTAGILSATTQSAISCSKWTVMGTCLWLKCGLSGCSVKTSIKVGHYNPDLVVSSYHNVGENPWTEIRTILGVVQQDAANALINTLSSTLADMALDAGGGNGAMGDQTRMGRRLVYKEADAVGHPAAFLLNTVAQQIPTLGNFFCKSEVTPFFPYYTSAIDPVGWRYGIPEAVYPQALIPGMADIGRWPLNSWGPLYPRSGLLVQAEGPKAAAVIAQRVGSIVTAPSQPHIYIHTASNLDQLPTSSSGSGGGAAGGGAGGSGGGGAAVGGGGSSAAKASFGSRVAAGATKAAGEAAVMAIQMNPTTAQFYGAYLDANAMYGMAAGIYTAAGMVASGDVLGAVDGLLNGGGGQKVWPPGPLKVNNAKTGTWQMLAPTQDTECAVFGKPDLLRSWAGGRGSSDERYAFALWRPYKCCQKRGQAYLGSIDIKKFPE